MKKTVIVAITAVLLSLSVKAQSNNTKYYTLMLVGNNGTVFTEDYNGVITVKDSLATIKILLAEIKRLSPKKFKKIKPFKKEKEVHHFINYQLTEGKK